MMGNYVTISGYIEPDTKPASNGTLTSAATATAASAIATSHTLVIISLMATAAAAMLAL